MKADLGSQLIDRESRRALTFAIIFLAGILLLCATGLFPAYAKGRQVQRRILSLKEERNVQQQLQPFIVALMTAEHAIMCPPELVHVEKSPLPRERLLDFDKQIIAMAEQFELKAVSVEVKVDAINRSDLVVVDARLTGDFNNFKGFLLSLGQVSWVQAFDSLEIIGEPNQEKMKVEFKMALE
jgi:hypothetical protein